MMLHVMVVVLDTTKVQIFKQITTPYLLECWFTQLFQIPQRYRFSSKSQHKINGKKVIECCFRYHKGTDFQANHNKLLSSILLMKVVLDTTKVQIFKQITTNSGSLNGGVQLFQIPQRYRFSSKSQRQDAIDAMFRVVLDTTKVQIFKQITTTSFGYVPTYSLFQIPQRYRFSSKSQLPQMQGLQPLVVLDTTKVQIFKQITTKAWYDKYFPALFQIPQRYRFSSKSQLLSMLLYLVSCCFRYHKGTDFQANHNGKKLANYLSSVVLDTTKVQIFKQITTNMQYRGYRGQVVLDTTKVQIFKQITTCYVYPSYFLSLFQIPQRYRFSSKSQLKLGMINISLRCFRYHKGTDFQANHNQCHRCSCCFRLFQIPQRYRFSSKSQQR